ncbi:armadillo-type protein [Gorgonomyces haynaldii]|nr:armadillo-type protein [Gorgonomyces haynaldii]
MNFPFQLMTMSISGLLENTLSPIQNVREEAVAQLDAFSKDNFTHYMGLLCQELSSTQNGSHIRSSAGLMMKNAVTAKDFERQEELSQRWLHVDPQAREQIKQAVLQALRANESSTGKVAGQVIAAIANVELPQGQWQDLIPSLLPKLGGTESETTKKSTLQAIGFICETLDPNILETHSSAILTAVAEGARKEQPNNEVRLAAMQALYNSLEFIRGNFDREAERNYVMQIVCESTQCEHTDVQVVAFECLVKIMTLYYEKMGFYMEKALYGLTLLGMRHVNEKVVLQAIEFWSTVFELEADIIYESESIGEAPQVFHNFSAISLKEIAPILLFLMTKKEEDDDEDEWNVSMAAATCLQLLSSATRSAIVAHVLPFVEEHIKNPDWRFREASVMAFGSILEGPEPKDVSPLVSLALPTLIQLMNDPVIHIKDTAAWTLGRICELVMDTLTEQELQSIIQAVTLGLNDSPRVASNCAWCIINLSEHPGAADQSSSLLDKYFQGMLMALTQAAEKPGQDTNFRAAAYEAISTLVANSSNATMPIVSNLVSSLLDSLNATIAQAEQMVGADEKRAHYDHQANLCSVLTSIVRRLGQHVRPIADNIMQVLLHVISHASKNSTVMEDAFLAIGALTTACEGDFARYMEAFMPFLLSALENFEEHQMCVIAIGLVGDICRALNEQVVVYYDHFIQRIAHLLENPTVHRSIKPTCLSCVGDLALASGGHFERFVQPFMTVIATLTQSVNAIPLSTTEKYDYVCQMREGIAEAYVGMAQGLKSAEKGNLLLPYTQSIFHFIQSAAEDSERPEFVTRSLIGLLGDLADTFPPGILKPSFGMPWIEKLLKEAKHDRNASPQTKEIIKWAKEMIRRQVM